MGIVDNYLSGVQIDTYMERDLMQSLEIYRESTQEGNKTIKDEFDAVQHLVNDQQTLLFKVLSYPKLTDNNNNNYPLLK